MTMTSNSNSNRTNPSNRSNKQRKPWNGNSERNNSSNFNNKKKFGNNNNKPDKTIKDPNDRSALGLPNKSPARFRSSLMTQSRLSSHVKLNDRVKVLSDQGWNVEFGTIGKHTTWCLLEKNGHEIIGYTYVEKLETFNPELGKSRALTQALARKSLQDNERAILEQKKKTANDSTTK